MRRKEVKFVALFLLSILLHSPCVVGQTSRTTVFKIHCSDIYNGEWIKAEVAAITSKGTLNVGQCDEQGNITLNIPPNTTSLRFRATRYADLVLPLHIDPAWTEVTPIPISVAMIGSDSLLSIQKYSSDLNRRKLKIIDFDSTRQTLIRLYEPAFTNLTGAAQVCLTFPTSKTTKCQDAIIGGDPVLFDLKETRNITLEVNSNAGFGSFKDVIKEVKLSSGSFYEVGMVRSTFVAFDVRPDSARFDHIFKTPSGRVQFSSNRFDKRDGKALVRYGIVGSVEGTYNVKFVIHPNGRIINDTFKVKPGFNFKIFDLSGPDSVQVDTMFRSKTQSARILAPTAILPQESTQVDSSKAGFDQDWMFRSHNAYFYQSEYDLRPDARMVLDSVADFILAAKKYRLMITGYTDNIGDSRLNLALSEYRARVVAKYLRDKGVEDSHMTVDWKGSDNAISNNSTENARVRSRRVEIRLK